MQPKINLLPPNYRWWQIRLQYLTNKLSITIISLIITGLAWGLYLLMAHFNQLTNQIAKLQEELAILTQETLQADQTTKDQTALLSYLERSHRERLKIAELFHRLQRDLLNYLPPQTLHLTQEQVKISGTLEKLTTLTKFLSNLKTQKVVKDYSAPKITRTTGGYQFTLALERL